MENAEEKPVISSFCPAIVRLIQVRFPALVDNILLVKAPVNASATYYHKILEGQGSSLGRDRYLLCYALRSENRRLEGSGRLLIYDQRRDKYGYPI